jgi:hypothetical protein
MDLRAEARWNCDSGNSSCADVACIDDPCNMFEAVRPRLLIHDSDQPAIMPGF